MSIQIKKYHQFTGHSGPVYTLAQGQKQYTVFSASSDKFIAEWNLETRTQEKFSVQLDLPVISICHIPEHKLLLAGLMNGSLHIFDLEKKQEIKHFTQHKAGIFDIQYSIKNNCFYTSDADGYFCVWSISELKLLLTFPVSQGKIRNICLFSDHSKLALSCADGTIKVLETEFYNETQSLQAHTDAVNSLCFIGENLLLSGGKDAYLKLWDMTTGLNIQSIPAHNYAIYSIALDFTGKFFATASRDKTVKIWDVHTLEIIKRIERKNLVGHMHSVNKLLWSEFNNLLVTTGDDRVVNVWEITED